MDDLHLVDVEDEQLVALNLLFVLINEREEVNAALHVIKGLKRKVVLVWLEYIFLVFEFILQLLEGHLLDILA